jgi:hypothetical protein
MERSEGVRDVRVHEIVRVAIREEEREIGSADVRVREFVRVPIQGAPSKRSEEI